MPIRAGELRYRVTVQRVESRVVAGDAGEPTQTGMDTLAVWAGFRHVSGSEQFRAGQRLAVETGIFTVRKHRDWSPGVASHQLVFRNRTWDITYVAELPSRDGWELTAEVRGTPGGA